MDEITAQQDSFNYHRLPRLDQTLKDRPRPGRHAFPGLLPGAAFCDFLWVNCGPSSWPQAQMPS
jgi:hypothetical protein